MCPNGYSDRRSAVLVQCWSAAAQRDFSKSAGEAWVVSQRRQVNRRREIEGQTTAQPWPDLELWWAQGAGIGVRSPPGCFRWRSSIPRPMTSLGMA